MPTPHCLRYGSTRRHLIAVVNTASRARFKLCGRCLTLVVKEMRPRSRRAVERAILEQASRRAS